MIELWKIKLRAWLIDLVREAIRIENIALYRKTAVSQNAYIPQTKKPASKPVTEVPEPSFERMEREAIADQEKHYAPQPRG